MSRRARAVAFLALAGVAAVLAASLAQRYGSSVAGGYGPLRPVVVAVRGLRAGAALDPVAASGSLASRRVPARFVPAGALRRASEAVGLAPATDLPAGSYLVAAALRAPRPPRSRLDRLGALPGARRPVELSVSGSEALLAGRSEGRRAKVDVVVTTEPSAAGPGRAYVAAAAVPLLALSPTYEGTGPGGTGAATLALTRRQALRLIAAESFARQLTLLRAG